MTCYHCYLIISNICTHATNNLNHLHLFYHKYKCTLTDTHAHYSEINQLQFVTTRKHQQRSDPGIYRTVKMTIKMIEHCSVWAIKCKYSSWNFHSKSIQKPEWGSNQGVINQFKVPFTHESCVCIVQRCLKYSGSKITSNFHHIAFRMPTLFIT